MSDLSQDILYTDFGLDTDADYAYVGNGSSPYFLNILVGEDGANGIITNSKGNTQGATSYPLTLSEIYKVVGSYYNRLTRKCYYFVFSLPYDSDLSGEYLYDNKLLCYNEDTETIDCIFTDTGNYFGLSPWHYMKDCRMIGTWLFFNPKVSEPKMIDVDMAFVYEKAQIRSGTTSVGGYYEWSDAPTTYVYGDAVIYLGGYFVANQAVAAGESPVTNPEKWDRLADCYQDDTGLNFDSEFAYAFDVLKMPPVVRPAIAYGTDTEIQSNNVRGKAFRFAYRYKYFDDCYSVYSAFSDLSLPVDDEEWNGEIMDDTSSNNYIAVTVSLHSPALVKEVEIIYQEIGHDWKRCKSINRKEQEELDTVNFTFNFFNNEAYYEVVDSRTVYKIYDAVPRGAYCQEVISKNILAYGRCTEGFDNLDKNDIDVSLTPDYLGIDTVYDVGAILRDNVVNAATDITTEVIWDGEEYDYYTIINVAAFAAWGVVAGSVYRIVVDGHEGIVTFAPADVTGSDVLVAAIRPIILGSYLWTEYTAGTGLLRIGSNNGAYPNVSVSLFYTPAGTATTLTKAKGFKTGANHPFCIFYYDDPLRRWDAQTSKENLHGVGWEMLGTTVYVPMFNEVSSPAIDTATRWIIDWEVSHLPPTGAKYWRWGYAGNSLCSWFVQYIISDIDDGIAADAEAEMTYIDITPLQTIKDTTEDDWNQFPSSNIDPYEWEKGDRIRFITKETDPGTPGTLLGNVIEGVLDYEIIKFVEDTNRVYIQLINHAALDLGENTLAEIYRPIKSNTKPTFYEFGSLMPIVEDADGVLVHGGIDQNQEYGTATPATGRFDYGDVYHILRTPDKPLDDAAPTVGAYHEAMWWSDFYDSDEWDQGKTGYETNFNERTLNIIRYSNQYLQNTGINGFSTFDTNPESTSNMGYKELNDVYGSIMAMVEVGNTLKVYQRTKPCSILIGRQEYMDSEGQSNVVVSNTVLGAVRYSTTNYGTEFPESISVNNRYVYGFDIYNGVVWRDSANGIFPISGRSVGVEGSSDYRMATWFKEKAKALLISGASNVNVMSVWDEEYKLLYMSFKDNVEDDNSITIAFHEPSNRWISFYDFEQVNHSGYNVFLELDYEVVRGFSAGIGYYFDDSDRFAYFDIDTTNDISVFPSLITLDMTQYTPAITASGSGGGDQQELAFTLYTPGILITSIDVDDDDLEFLSTEGGFTDALPVVVTCTQNLSGVVTNTDCVITEMPTWVEVADVFGDLYDLSGREITGGETVYIYPTQINYGAERSGNVILTSDSGETVTISIVQDAKTISGQFSILSATETELTITNEGGYVYPESGRNVYITFTPDNIYYSSGEQFLMTWRAYVNGDYASTGAFWAYDEVVNSDIRLILGRTVTSDDSIVIYLDIESGSIIV